MRLVFRSTTVSDEVSTAANATGEVKQTVKAVLETLNPSAEHAAVEGLWKRCEEYPNSLQIRPREREC